VIDCHTSTPLSVTIYYVDDAVQLRAVVIPSPSASLRMNGVEGNVIPSGVEAIVRLSGVEA
jgi:hypothetical protein